MILQRRLNNSDGWRSVVEFTQENAAMVQMAALILSEAGAVVWRTVYADRAQQVISSCDGLQWRMASGAPSKD